MAEKGKDTLRSPRGRRTLLALGATGSLGAVLATGACSSSPGFDSQTGVYTISCSGAVPHTAYTFIDKGNQIASSHGEFEFDIALSKGEDGISVETKGQGYEVGLHNFSGYVSADNGQKIAENSQFEVIAGKLIGADEKRHFVDANTNFTVACASDITNYGNVEKIPSSAFASVYWQDVQLSGTI